MYECMGRMSVIHRSGLYGPIFCFLSNDICKGPRSMCHMSDLKVPTYWWTFQGEINKPDEARF
jgi:hypothetical protein